MTDSTSLAAQIEALAEKATPGPLMMYGEPDVGLRTEPFFGTPLKGGMRPLADWRAYDADLAVTLRNSLPAIIAALRADQRCAELEAENARLREAWRNYGRHKSNCPDMREGWDAGPCECGFELARAALENRDD